MNSLLYDNSNTSGPDNIEPALARYERRAAGSLRRPPLALVGCSLNRSRMRNKVSHHGGVAAAHATSARSRFAIPRPFTQGSPLKTPAGEHLRVRSRGGFQPGVYGKCLQNRESRHPYVKEYNGND